MGKKCKFKINQSLECNEKSGYNTVYCAEHRDMVCCVCGAEATHYCFERDMCKAPLCNNSYCRAIHNKHFKHAKTIWEN